MSSEKLGSAKELLKGNLGGSWDILEGCQGNYTDLGIARRFGGAAAAYSLRDIGAMNGRVVKVRRSNDATEIDFSANQVKSGAVEDFCDNVLTVGTAVNGTGSFGNYTFTANGNTGFDADNSGGGTGSAGFPYTFKNGDVMIVTYTVSNFNDNADGSALSPQIRGTNATSSVTSVAIGGTTFTANGTYTDTLTATADGTHLMFADGNTGSYTISNFAVTSHKTNGFVTTWYDQSGNGLDMVQSSTGSQPKIVSAGTQVKSNNLPAITFADNAVHLERAEFLTGQLGGYFIVGNTLKADQDGTDAQVLLRQGSNYRIAIELINAGNIRSFLRDDAGDNADARTTSTTVGDDEVFLNTTILTARGSSGMANFFNGGDESTADTTDVEDTDFSSADTGNISIGSIPAGTFDYKGELQEIILFNTNVSSDRTDIENEINSYYQIY